MTDRLSSGRFLDFTYGVSRRGTLFSEKYLEFSLKGVVRVSFGFHLFLNRTSLHTEFENRSSYLIFNYGIFGVSTQKFLHIVEPDFLCVCRVLCFSRNLGVLKMQSFVRLFTELTFVSDTKSLFPPTKSPTSFSDLLSRFSVSLSESPSS